MPLNDIFSKRQKRARGDIPDVFAYDTVPQALRVQIIHIFRDALGHSDRYGHASDSVYRFIHDALAREYGVFQLAEGRAAGASIEHFLLKEENVERVLDAVEMTFQFVESARDDWQYQSAAEPKISADDAVNELNARFREHGVGYQYESGELIRVDSQIVHTEVVKPALQLLRDPAFSGSNTEYLRAFEHYRHGRFEEVLAECLKAFESLMKAICEKRHWPYNQNDTARKLIETCFANVLIPAYLQSEFSALRTSLESGVPTVRNKQSGHGQGTQPRVVPRYLASYLLHLTGTNLLFLADSEAALP